MYIKASTFSYLNTFSDKTETLTSMAATSATQCYANESSTISAGIHMRAPIGGLSVDFMSVIAILAVAQDASFFGESFGKVVCKMTAGYYCSIGDNGSSGSNIDGGRKGVDNFYLLNDSVKENFNLSKPDNSNGGGYTKKEDVSGLKNPIDYYFNMPWQSNQKGLVAPGRCGNEFCGQFFDFKPSDISLRYGLFPELQLVETKTSIWSFSQTCVRKSSGFCSNK